MCVVCEADGFKLQGREGKAPDVLNSLCVAVTNVWRVCVFLCHSLPVQQQFKETQEQKYL